MSFSANPIPCFILYGIWHLHLVALLTEAKLHREEVARHLWIAKCQSLKSSLTSFEISSSLAPREARPISWLNWAKLTGGIRSCDCFSFLGKSPKNWPWVSKQRHVAKQLVAAVRLQQNHVWALHQIYTFLFSAPRVCRKGPKSVECTWHGFQSHRTNILAVRI